MHLFTVANMLTVFAAKGCCQGLLPRAAAKGCRLYLEMMDKHSTENKALMDLFKVHGLHTVRDSEFQRWNMVFQWCGIWTDLSIKQKLMRAGKSSGGLTGGKLRNQKSAHKV